MGAYLSTDDRIAERVVDHLRRKGACGVRELSSALVISPDRIVRAIHELIEAKRVVRAQVGPDRFMVAEVLGAPGVPGASVPPATPGPRRATSEGGLS